MCWKNRNKQTFFFPLSELILFLIVRILLSIGDCTRSNELLVNTRNFENNNRNVFCKHETYLVQVVNSTCQDKVFLVKI